MKNNIIKFNEQYLEKMLKAAKDMLLAKKYRKKIPYPENINKKNWDNEVEKINLQSILLDFKKCNLYAIFIDDEEFPRYIGQRKSGDLVNRLRQHLIKKHKKTSSKLFKIQECVCSDNSVVYINCIQIEPDSCRKYIEEQLVQENNKNINGKSWNIHE